MNGHKVNKHIQVFGNLCSSGSTFSLIFYPMLVFLFQPAVARSPGAVCRVQGPPSTRTQVCVAS